MTGRPILIINQALALVATGMLTWIIVLEALS